MVEPTDDHLALDLHAFITEHRRCGDLDTGMIETESARLWLMCSCGARIERLVSPASSMN